MDVTENMVAEQGVDNPSGTESTTPEEPHKGAEGKTDIAFSKRLSQEKAKLEKSYSPYKEFIEKQAKQANMTPEQYLEYASKKQEEDSIKLESEKTGKDPEVLKAERREREASERLAQYELKEKLTAEEKELVADKEIGPFVTDNLEQIKQIATGANVDLKTALAIVAAEKLPELLKAADPDTHIKEYLKKVKEGGKPIEMNDKPANEPRKETVSSFDKARASALQRLKGNK